MCCYYIVVFSKKLKFFPVIYGSLPENFILQRLFIEFCFRNVSSCYIYRNKYEKPYVLFLIYYNNFAKCNLIVPVTSDHTLYNNYSETRNLIGQYLCRIGQSCMKKLNSL